MLRGGAAAPADNVHIPAGGVFTILSGALRISIHPANLLIGIADIAIGD